MSSRLTTSDDILLGDGGSDADRLSELFNDSQVRDNIMVIIDIKVKHPVRIDEVLAGES